MKRYLRPATRPPARLANACSRPLLTSRETETWVLMMAPLLGLVPLPVLGVLHPPLAAGLYLSLLGFLGFHLLWSRSRGILVRPAIARQLTDADDALERISRAASGPSGIPALASARADARMLHRSILASARLEHRELRAAARVGELCRSDRSDLLAGYGFLPNLPLSRAREFTARCEAAREASARLREDVVAILTLADAAESAAASLLAVDRTRRQHADVLAAREAARAGVIERTSELRDIVQTSAAIQAELEATYPLTAYPPTPEPRPL